MNHEGLSVTNMSQTDLLRQSEVTADKISTLHMHIKRLTCSSEMADHFLRDFLLALKDFLWPSYWQLCSLQQQ